MLAIWHADCNLLRVKVIEACFKASINLKPVNLAEGGCDESHEIQRSYS